MADKSIMTINGKTRLCGVIGNPVEHTMSPIIHNTLSEYYDKNLIYVPFYVKDGDIEAAIKGAHALNILGLNVTVPYKMDVIPYLVDIDDLAKRIGAVNTLVRCENGYKGYNTDVLGLGRAFEISGIKVNGNTVVVLGAGGASRAVVFLCESLGAAKIYLFNRTIDKAEALANEVNEYSGRDLVIPMLMSDIEKIEENDIIAIQATSVGLHPNNEDVVTTCDAFYSKISKAYDLIYKPTETKFMRLVKEHGGEAYNGLSMLNYQGVIAYELWNEMEISEEAAKITFDKLMGAVD